jgi:multiple sugar transport system permease protein
MMELALRAAKPTGGYMRWLLVLPVVAYLLMFTVYPILVNIYIGISSGAIFSLFSLPQMDTTLVNTGVFTAGAVTIEFLVGLGLALMVDRVKKGAGLFALAYTIPVLISPIAVGVIWLLILDPQFGPLNYFLSFFGIQGPFWVGQQNTIMLSAIIASAWEETPIVFLILYAGLRGIPRQVYEAAAMDGLGGFSLLRRVVLPMMKPTLVVAGLLALMTSFRSFDLVYMFAINGPFAYVQTLPFFLYNLAFYANFQDYGSALSLLIMAIALVPTFILLHMMRIDERLGLTKPRTDEGKQGVLGKFGIIVKRKLPHLRVRKMRTRKAVVHVTRERKWVSRSLGPLMYIVLSLVAILALFPVYWLLVTSVKTFDEIFPTGGGATFFPLAIDLSNWATALNQMSGYIITSMVVTATVVLVTLLFAIPTAYSISRFKTGGTWIVSWNIIVNSLPSVVFAIPLFLIVRTAHIYNTWFALIATYPIFTIPIAVWLLIGFVEEIPKQIDDAARIDGLGTLGILSRMIFPLMKPGIVAVVILSIINCWHEFLLTLILGLTVFNGQIPIGARGVTVYLSNFLSATGINWATVSAGSIIVSFPLIVMVILLQKYYVSGLTLGAVKG